MEEQEWLFVSSEDGLGNVHEEVVRAPFHLSGEGMDSETWLKVLKFANEYQKREKRFVTIITKANVKLPINVDNHKQNSGSTLIEMIEKRFEYE